MKKVSVRVTYECGRCGNMQRRTYEAKDGLLEIPQVYCGNCVGHRHFTVLSATISDERCIEVEETNATAEVQGLVGRDVLLAAGEKALKTMQSAEGRVDPNKPDSGTREPETGIGSAEGLHSVPPVKAKVAGKPAK